MSNVTKNLNVVKERIRNAYLKRPVDQQIREPRLVAVSKTKSIDSIIEAYNSGQRHFGENYVQEIVDKGVDKNILNICTDIKWHFIGHLQRNKVGKLLTIPNLFIVETIDSEKLADALNVGVAKSNEAQKLNVGVAKSNEAQKLNVYIQVNTSGEAAKSGCRPEDAGKLVKYIIENCKYLNVLGLMTIGKYGNRDPQVGVNPDFQCLVNCRDEVCKNLGLNKNDFELSMGMSGDFEHAVELGATNVRVGSLIFGERKPYQVLIDGTICVCALKNQVNIQEQFPKYLEGEAKLLTTQCIVKEVEKLGPSTFGALLIIKKFGTHQCGHEKSPLPASQCILDMIGENNASRYIIATQDRELQEKCRRLKAVPLLYLHTRTPTLEPPSAVTQSAANEKSLRDFQVSDLDKKKLSLMKKEEETEEQTRKKRKRKGGPNPLSCKRKKKKPEEEGGKRKDKDSTPKKKRKRNRSRLVKKIKSELMASLNR